MAFLEILRLVFAVWTAFMLLIAGLSKVTGQQSMRDTADHFGIAWPRYRAIGCLEVVAIAGIVLGFWWTWIGVAAGAGVVLLMIGAVVVHVRARDEIKATMPAIIVLLASGGYFATQVAVAM